MNTLNIDCEENTKARKGFVELLFSADFDRDDDEYGWYCRDEHGCWHGPYETSQQAESARLYMELLAASRKSAGYVA